MLLLVLANMLAAVLAIGLTAIRRHACRERMLNARRRMPTTPAGVRTSDTPRAMASVRDLHTSRGR